MHHVAYFYNVLQYKVELGGVNRATRNVIISTETHNSVRIAHREGILALLDELMASAT